MPRWPNSPPGCGRSPSGSCSMMMRRSSRSCASGLPPRAGGLPPDPVREMAPQHGLRRHVGLLQIDTPVFELFERDRRAGHGATHEGAGPQHAEIAVEVLDLGLARHRGRAIEPVQHCNLQRVGPGLPNFSSDDGRPPERGGWSSIMVKARTCQASICDPPGLLTRFLFVVLSSASPRTPRGMRLTLAIVLTVAL